MILLAIAACVRNEPSTPIEIPPPEMDVVETPVGPTDPLVVACCGEHGYIHDPEPVVLDETGAVVALEPGWRPSGGVWAPGLYEVTGVVGADPTPSVPFEIERWGLDPLERSLVGRAWEVTDHLSDQDLFLTLLGVDPTAVLVVEDIEGDQALFSLVARVDGAECRVLRDFGTLTANGSGLDWARDTLEIPLPADADGVSTTAIAHGLSLSVRWHYATRRAWGTTEVTLDTRNLGPLTGPSPAEDAICTLTATVGQACGPCPDGGPFCLPGEAHAIRLAEIELPDLDALPACGLDFAEGTGLGGLDLPPLGCDIEPGDFQLCSCRTYGASAGLPMLLVVLVTGSRRRGRPGRA